MELRLDPAPPKFAPRPNSCLPGSSKHARARPVPSPDLVGALAAAGATWWSEWLHPLRGDLDTIRTRIRQGPPRG
jgi:hypothetical protein